MGDSAFLVLAVALCAVFGGGGVLLGLYMGVRTITRDEERFGMVALACDTMRGDLSRLKIEWGTTLEEFEQLAGAVEKGRRRSAASLSQQERKERELLPHEPAVPMTSQEERNEIRRRMRG